MERKILNLLRYVPADICRKNLCRPIDFKIPKISAIRIEHKLVIQIPVKVHTSYRELDCLFAVPDFMKIPQKNSWPII